MSSSTPVDFDLHIFACFSYRLCWFRRRQVPIGRERTTLRLRMICRKNDLLHQEISPRVKSVKTAPNACVVIFGKAQTDEDGIIQWAIATSNFSMWDNATQHSYRELYGPEVRMPTMNRNFFLQLPSGLV